MDDCKLMTAKGGREKLEWISAIGYRESQNVVKFHILHFKQLLVILTSSIVHCNRTM